MQLPKTIIPCLIRSSQLVGIYLVLIILVPIFSLGNYSLAENAIPERSSSNKYTIRPPKNFKVYRVTYSKPKVSPSTSKIWPNRLRGLNTKLVFPIKKNSTNPGGFLPETIFKKLVAWHVNVIRVPVNADVNIFKNEKSVTLSERASKDVILAYSRHLKGLAHTLRLAKKYNIYVIVSAGRVVNRRKMPLYSESDRSGYWKGVVRLWKHIAREFGKHDKLLAYDLLNEPDCDSDIWQAVVLSKIIEAIREVDKDTYLVIEPAPGGSYRSFKDFVPVSDPKAVYSFHFYAPHNYTHQGIGKRQLIFEYPGYIKHFNHSPLLYWDEEQLERQVRHVVAFQEKFHKRIFAGEFGVVRWASGGAKWLEDVIHIAEKHGWDWCFFSFGGWNGWNPTFESDDPISNEIDGHKHTKRLKVLLRSWEKNCEDNSENI